jgi:hypothetical protein
MSTSRDNQKEGVLDQQSRPHETQQGKPGVMGKIKSIFKPKHASTTEGLAIAVIPPPEQTTFTPVQQSLIEQQPTTQIRENVTTVTQIPQQITQPIQENVVTEKTPTEDLEAKESLRPVLQQVQQEFMEKKHELDEERIEKETLRHAVLPQIQHCGFRVDMSQTLNYRF